MKSPAELRQMLENHLGKLCQEDRWQGPMYEPMAYLLQLGGKRIRPLLLLLTYQALSGKDAAKALNAATAVELFHNFSLMHDDIMDNAPVRRGQATVHEKWDDNTAILSGDAMFAMTFELLIRDFPDLAAKLVTEYNEIALGVCEGQMSDMLMAESAKASLPEYLEMIRQKTAMLIGGAMSLAALAAGADSQMIGLIREYGELVGIGFQLQDDYLDVYAEQAKFGKQIAGDILENKKTWLLLTAMEKSGPEQRKQLDFYLFKEKDDEAKIQGIKAIYQAMGIPEEIKKLILTYFDKAEKTSEQLRHLEGFHYISAFFNDLMKRDF